MTKIQMIEQLLKVYDERDSLQAKVVELGGSLENINECQPMSQMAKFALYRGRKVIEDELIRNSWQWRNYAPSIRYSQEEAEQETDEKYMPFEEWFEKISISEFDSYRLLQMFEAGVASFAEFKLFVKDALREEYENKLQAEKQAEKASQQTEV